MASPKGQCAKCGKEFSMNQLMRCSHCKRVLYCSNACQFSHWRSHKKTCASPADASAPVAGPSSQTGKEADAVVGITIACEADRRRGSAIFTPTIIHPSHPVWSQGQSSPLFRQIGLPIIVYRDHPGNPLTMIGNAGLDNQIATYLMVEPSTGFAGYGWVRGGVVGTVIVVRQDKKPLTCEAIETLWMYADFILDLYGEGYGTPARQLTPQSFRRFCKEYKEGRLLNGYEAFEDMPLPL
ncbi:hypothetical protein F5J12DRAFT_839343 [Pisolithus orientalis]|uniref:uncharacterized protein n=1 Tax=Pisolithus orientalis TaxID=936130 RepID=UPI0022256878|nr:uncharacterized protein F5J12DRAFT_839343 [Pisolithus orientalis]KAI6003253.1 hypothetical protein F5J12DRAFT_839343 [Pisolithus orientalis]